MCGKSHKLGVLAGEAENEEWRPNRGYMHLEGLQSLSDTVPTRLSAMARWVPRHSACPGCGLSPRSDVTARATCMENPLSRPDRSAAANPDPDPRDAVTKVSITRAQVESSYRRYAPVYDLLFGASLGPGRVAMARLVSRLSVQHVLEVGVGTGLTLAHYPDSARITGVDVSRDMLATAQRRVRPEDAGRIELRAMDAEAMDFADASFDCVTLPYVLSVTPNPDRLLAEVRRVCRPGGHIVIVNHFSGQRQWRSIEVLLRPLAAWLGFRTEFSLEQHVLRQPWQVLSVEPVNLLSLSRLIHVRKV